MKLLCSRCGGGISKWQCMQNQVHSSMWPSHIVVYHYSWKLRKPLHSPAIRWKYFQRKGISSIQFGGLIFLKWPKATVIKLFSWMINWICILNMTHKTWTIETKCNYETLKSDCFHIQENTSRKHVITIMFFQQKHKLILKKECHCYSNNSFKGEQRQMLQMLKLAY
jgi:hypothetical protein